MCHSSWLWLPGWRGERGAPHKATHARLLPGVDQAHSQPCGLCHIVLLTPAPRVRAFGDSTFGSVHPLARFASQSAPCEPGTWSSGGSHADCVSCGGDGWTTVETPGVLTSEEFSGATSAAHCAVAPGYELQDKGDPAKGLWPCLQGTFKSMIGNATCVACPSGAGSPSSGDQQR